MPEKSRHGSTPLINLLRVQNLTIKSCSNPEGLATALFVCLALQKTSPLIEGPQSSAETMQIWKETLEGILQGPLRLPAPPSEDLLAVGLLAAFVVHH